MTDVTSPLLQTELFGHHTVLQQWQQALATGKLHHGLLITGPQGVGKATLAYHFLKDMFKKQSDQPHLVDKQIVAGSYPALKIIERLFDEKRQRYGQEITRDAVQPIFDFLRLSVVGGGYRAVVIDGADTMNRNAQNAILKLLEEPPARTLFFLLVEQTGRLLPTIRSRCMQYNVTPLSLNDFSTALKTLAPDIPSSSHTALYHLADGALGQAVTLNAQNWDDLYSDAVKAALSLQTSPKIAMKWAENLTPSTQDDAYDLLQQIMSKRMAQMITALQRGETMSPLVPDEGALLTHWQAIPATLLTDAYTAMTTLFNMGSRSHLDRKIVLLQALEAFGGRDVPVASQMAKG